MKIAPKQIVILRALQLGDLLCAVPAFRALRAGFPDASIRLVGLPWAADFVNRYSAYLDDWIQFPGYPGFPEQSPKIEAFTKFLAALHADSPDLAIQMQGSGQITNPLVALFGAKKTAGYFLPGDYCPDEELFLPYPADIPEPLRHLKLVEHLGIDPISSDLEFPLYSEDWAGFQYLVGEVPFRPGQYFCIHPGARSAARRWAPEKFAELGNSIGKMGYTVVLTGTQEERDIILAVQNQLEVPSVDLSGKLSLGVLAVVLSQARLLVCNDTGVSHLAAALRVPSVILFSGSDPNRWAPLNHILHRSILSANNVSARVVIEEVEAMLNWEHEYER